MSTILAHPAPLTLIDRWRPAEKAASLSYSAGLAVLGSLLLAVSAQLSVYLPWAPQVPITGQTFALFLIGALFGSRLAGSTVLLYLAEGCAGLPVFAGGAFGPVTLIGPTGGYLIGFVPTAMLIGALAERGWDRKVSTSVLAMAAGLAVTFACGLVHLTVYMTGFTGNFSAGLTSALTVGLLTPLPGGLLKMALAAALLPVGWKWLGRRGEGPAA
jgi:biotin transport system substrate-specific component